MEKVTGNLYVIIGNGGNVAAMPTSEGVLLVDDKFALDAPEIVAKVKPSATSRSAISSTRTSTATISAVTNR